MKIRFIEPDYEHDGLLYYVDSASGDATSIRLSFRVGLFDERLYESGITTLLLRCLSASLEDKHEHVKVGWQVAPLRSYLYLQGNASTVLEALVSMSRLIADLDFVFLDRERRLFQTSVVAGEWRPLDGALSLRFGLVGAGGTSLGPIAIQQITREQLQSWSAKYFVAENASLWAAGDVSDALQLQLPHGTLMSPQPPEPISELVFPCFQRSPPATRVQYSFQMPRTADSAVAFGAFCNTVSRRLSHMEGLVSHLNATTTYLDDKSAMSMMEMNVLESNASAALSGISESVEDLLADGGNELLFNDAKGQLLQSERELNAGPQRKSVGADTSLTDYGYTHDEYVAQIERTTIESLSASTLSMWESSLAQIPVTANPPSSFSERVTPTTPPVSGKSTRRTSIHNRGITVFHTRFIYGKDGVTLKPGGSKKQAVTVRFDACEAVLAEDTKLTFYGSNGAWVAFEPDLHDGGKKVSERLLALVPPMLLVGRTPEPSALRAKATRRGNSSLLPNGDEHHVRRYLSCLLICGGGIELSQC